jgi:hypothetical protein
MKTESTRFRRIFDLGKAGVSSSSEKQPIS